MQNKIFNTTDDIPSMVVYRNKWFNIIKINNVYDDEPYYGLETLDYVHVLAVINEKIVFVRQYRPLLRKSSLEFPGGHIEATQTPEEAARFELYEETGYISNRLELLCKLDPDTGRLTNKIWCYIAKDLKRDEFWEGEDGVTVEEHPVNKLNQLVISGEIINAYNLAELFMANLRSNNLNNI